MRAHNINLFLEDGESLVMRADRQVNPDCTVLSMIAGGFHAVFFDFDAARSERFFRAAAAFNAIMSEAAAPLAAAAE